MSRRSEIANAFKVKSALAAKYYALARARRSKPARERLFRHAIVFRNQAANLAEKLKD